MFYRIRYFDLTIKSVIRQKSIILFANNYFYVLKRKLNKYCNRGFRFAVPAFGRLIVGKIKVIRNDHMLVLGLIT